MPYVSARPSSKNPSWVVYIADDGSKTIRSCGSRSWRNNNPGNLRYTWFARDHRAIGTAGGFAVFPDYPTGRAALSALLHGTSYFNLSSIRPSPDTPHRRTMTRKTTDDWSLA